MSSPTAAPARGAAKEPALLRQPRFVAFAIGNTVNNIGEAVYAVALPLVAFQATGSLRAMALLAAAMPLAFVIDPLVGVAADRWGPRALVVPGLLLQAAAAVAMNLLLVAGAFSVWSLFCLAVLVEVGARTYRSGWITGVPTLFPEYPVRARATLNTLFFATTVIGPLVFAVAFHALSYTGVLWLNVGSFLAPLAIWAAGVRPPPVAGRPAEAVPSALRRGWQAVAQDVPLRNALIARALITLSLGPGALTLAVYRLRDEWHIAGGGVARMFAVLAVAGLAGNILATQRRRDDLHGQLTVAAGLLTVAALLLAAPAQPVFVLGVATLGLGTGLMIGTVVLLPVRRLRPDVLGRGYAVIGVVIGIPAVLSPGLALAASGVAGPAGAFALLSLGALAAFLHLRTHRW